MIFLPNILPKLFLKTRFGLGKGSLEINNIIPCWQECSLEKKINEACLTYISNTENEESPLTQ